MKYWINNSLEFKQYHIQYQEKEFFILAEVMFALIINQFKQRIEKHYIIEEIILELPFQNEIIKERMFICLEAIELKRIERENSIQIDYDYTT